MQSEILLVDGNYLCHYVFHGIGGLSTVAGNPTSIIYGMLVQIRNLAKKFKTKRIIFCWDSQESVRKQFDPEYKANRHKQEYTEEEALAMNAFYQQINKLQHEILREIGFPCFFKHGYESDDLLAWFALKLKGQKVIVTADADLWQCLSDSVVVYNPNKKEFMTQERLKEEYRITPADWRMVKAIAGCPSDNVKGVEGVGEKTAIKFLNDELLPNSVKNQKICYEMGTSWHNLELVTLPHKTFKMVKPKIQFKISLEAFKTIAKEIEAESLLEPECLMDWKRIATRY